MRYLSALIFSLFCLSSFSQNPLSVSQGASRVSQGGAQGVSPARSIFPPVSYPLNYFRDPLDIPMSLAANFGELRPNHYHMGLDIRTQQRENLPVRAAADGYVARVRIEPLGFGQAIYINHPNGYTTLYAHLNSFFPALAAYVAQQQYKLQSWETELEIPPALFPVRKGDLIAYSGNRGGSQGPHLHFEIRRTAGDINLNPLLFGLPVPDNTPPVIQRLALYDRHISLYEQSPRILPVHKASGRPGSYAAAYAPTPGLLTVASSRISFAISAFDTQSGSANPNGIFQAVLYDNEQPVIGFQMDHISYDNTRNINAHIDYKTRETGGPFLQHLSILPGYPSPSIYRTVGSDGVVDLGDGRPHNIRIEVKDAYGNTSELKYQVQYKAVRSAGTGNMPSSSGVPAGQRSANPDAANGAVPPGKRFYPGMIDGYEAEGCAFYLGEKSLYDSVTLTATRSGFPGGGYTLPGGISDTYTIGAPWIPLLDPILVRLQPVHAFRVDSLSVGGWTSLTDQIVMVCSTGSHKDIQRVEWHDGWASARFREFGNFQLVDDTVPPVILPLGPLEGADLSGASRIAFSVKDNLGAIRRFRAELDGSWLCFTNDKELAYIYTFDEHCPAGKHTLKVAVEDVAGNKTVRYYKFTR